jgi:hypothetical protein
VRALISRCFRAAGLCFVRSRTPLFDNSAVGDENKWTLGCNELCATNIKNSKAVAGSRRLQASLRVFLPTSLSQFV